MSVTNLLVNFDERLTELRCACCRVPQPLSERRFPAGSQLELSGQRLRFATEAVLYYCVRSRRYALRASG